MDIFSKSFVCDKCTKNKVCRYKNWVIEVYSKIDTHISNMSCADFWCFTF